MKTFIVINLIITLGGFHLCRAELLDLPGLMVKEIKLIPRIRRTPVIIIDMMKECENLEPNQKKGLLEDWTKCVVPHYLKNFTTDLESLNNDCMAFYSTVNCYDPLKQEVNKCYGEGTDSFQYTTALFNFVCKNNQKTIDQIKDKQFTGFDSDVSSAVSTCLIDNYRNEPHFKNETCKSLAIVDHCIDKYMVYFKKPNETVDYFESMVQYLKKQLCEVPTPKQESSGSRSLHTRISFCIAFVFILLLNFCI